MQQELFPNEIRFDRQWAMPSRETYTIKPIADLLNEEMNDLLWIDPFAGNSSLANVTNDLNPDTEAMYHKDALEFLGMFSDKCVSGGVLYDPPYSVRQVAECYKQYGLQVTQETTRADFWTRIKAEIARVVAPGGKAISFGWNSGGIGKMLNFRIKRILLVPHGGIHNDTICTVEVKRLDKT